MFKIIYQYNRTFSKHTPSIDLVQTIHETFKHDQSLREKLTDYIVDGMPNEQYKRYHQNVLYHIWWHLK